MGPIVLEAGPSPAPGLDLFAHCLAGTPGGVAVVAVNTDRATPRAVTISGHGDRYTPTSSSGLQSHAIQVNKTTLALAMASEKILGLEVSRRGAGPHGRDGPARRCGSWSA
jgi:hypothetical protein